MPLERGLDYRSLIERVWEDPGGHARLEERIDEINFSGSCTDSGNADCKYSEKVDCLIEMVGTVTPYGNITAFTKLLL